MDYWEAVRRALPGRSRPAGKAAENTALQPNTRAVSLTEEGRRFYQQVMPHLRGMEEAAAAGSAATVRGKLRINLDSAFLRTLLGPKLDGFMDAHPEPDRVPEPGNRQAVSTGVSSQARTAGCPDEWLPIAHRDGARASTRSGLPEPA